MSASGKSEFTFFGFFTLMVVAGALVVALSVVGAAGAFVFGRWCAQFLGWA